MTPNRQTRPTRHLAAVAAAWALVAVTLLGALPAGAADTWNTTVTVTTATSDEVVLDVQGTGFTDLPNASTGSPAMGIYVGLRDASMTYAEIAADNNILAQVAYLHPGMLPAGNFSTVLSATGDDVRTKLDFDEDIEVITWVAHGNPTADTVLTTTVVLTDEQKQTIDPTWSPPTTASTSTSTSTPGQDTTTTTSTPGQDTTTTSSVPGDTTTTAPPPSTTPSTTPGSSAPSTTDAPRPAPTQAPSGTGPYCVTESVPGTLGTPQMTWAIKSSFASYIESNIAKGTIETGDGAIRSGTTFVWTTGSGELDSSNLGTWTFPGFVHFTGHDNVLNLTLSNLRVQVTGANSGTLVADIDSTDMEGVDVGGNNIAMADLVFSSVSPSGGSATVQLTPEGAAAFAGYYSAGEFLDPLTVQVSGEGAGTREVCYDADGNVVGANSSGGNGTLAATGYDPSGLIGPGAFLVALGALAVVFAARRRTSSNLA